MEGVTILQEIHTTNPAWIGFIMISVATIIVFCVGLIFRKEGCFGIVLVIVFGMLIADLPCLLDVIANGTETVSYLVIVDDSVSLNEFNKVYEIIGYKGNMLEVVLK